MKTIFDSVCKTRYCLFKKIIRECDIFLVAQFYKELCYFFEDFAIWFQYIILLQKY